MIDLKNIKIVHVEASSRCNSRCPMCSRYTNDGYLQPELKENDLSEDIFYKLFTVEFTSQLDHVYFSGVYGDPCLNKNLPNFVKYLIDNGCKSVSIDTNGGYRNESWWADLAIPNVTINFAIDGVDNDTLDRYRIGVIYDKVIKNLKSFTSAGGKAQWNFIVFKHNEHQVKQAEQLAKEYKADFRIKVTQKFRSKKHWKVMEDGKIIDTLEPPVNVEYRHPNVGINDHDTTSIIKFNLERYNSLNGMKVNCKSLQRKEIYLSANGLLFPCCYLGTYTHDSPGSYQFRSLYKLSNFDLNNLSVENIVDYMYTISNNWENTIKDGNLITCLFTCGNSENTTLYYDKSRKKDNIMKES